MISASAAVSYNTLAANQATNMGQDLQQQQQQASALKGAQKGWLSRWTRKQWSRHWFVLKNGSLTYYRGPAAEMCSFLDGVLDLSLIKHIDVSSQMPPPPKGHEHQVHQQQQQQQQHLSHHQAQNNLGSLYNFSLKMWNGECHILGAGSLAERAHWLEAINACIGNEDETATDSSGSSSSSADLSTSAASRNNSISSISNNNNNNIGNSSGANKTTTTLSSATTSNNNNNNKPKAVASREQTCQPSVGKNCAGPKSVAANNQLLSQVVLLKQQQSQQQKEAQLSLDQFALRLRSAAALRKQRIDSQEDKLRVTLAEASQRDAELVAAKQQQQAKKSIAIGDGAGEELLLLLPSRAASRAAAGESAQQSDADERNREELSERCNPIEAARKLISSSQVDLAKSSSQAAGALQASCRQQQERAQQSGCGQVANGNKSLAAQKAAEAEVGGAAGGNANGKQVDEANEDSQAFKRRLVSAKTRSRQRTGSPSKQNQEPKLVARSRRKLIISATNPSLATSELIDLSSSPEISSSVSLSSSSSSDSSCSESDFDPEEPLLGLHRSHKHHQNQRQQQVHLLEQDAQMATSDEFEEEKEDEAEGGQLAGHNRADFGKTVKKRVTFDLSKSTQRHLTSSSSSGSSVSGGSSSSEEDNTSQVSCCSSGSCESEDNNDNANANADDHQQQPEGLASGEVAELNQKPPSIESEFTNADSKSTGSVELQPKPAAGHPNGHPICGEDTEEETNCELVRCMIAKRRQRTASIKGNAGESALGKQRSSPQPMETCSSGATCCELVAMDTLVSATTTTTTTAPVAAANDAALAVPTAAAAAAVIKAEEGEQAGSAAEASCFGRPTVDSQLAEARQLNEQLERRLSDSLACYKQLELSYERLQAELIKCRELHSSELNELQRQVQELSRELESSQSQLLGKNVVAAAADDDDDNDETTTTTMAIITDENCQQQQQQQDENRPKIGHLPARQVPHQQQHHSTRALNLLRACQNGQPASKLLLMNHTKNALAINQQALGVKLLNHSKLIQRRLNELEHKVDRIHGAVALKEPRESSNNNNSKPKPELAADFGSQQQLATTTTTTTATTRMQDANVVPDKDCIVVKSK